MKPGDKVKLSQRSFLAFKRTWRGLSLEHVRARAKYFRRVFVIEAVTDHGTIYEQAKIKYNDAPSCMGVNPDAVWYVYTSGLLNADSTTDSGCEGNCSWKHCTKSVKIRD
jgi:hypothetical protein